MNTVASYFSERQTVFPKLTKKKLMAKDKLSDKCGRLNIKTNLFRVQLVIFAKKIK